MKTIKILIVLPLIIGGLSCKKENFVDKSSSMQTKSALVQNGSTSPNYAGVTNVNGTLSFDSYQDLMNTIEYLENAVESHVDAYVSELEQQGLDDDQITMQMQQDNFFMFQPLVDFETSLGFNSLRQEFWQAELDWLNSGGANSTDPNENMPLDKIAQTIVSPSYDVIIEGNSINMYDLNSAGAKNTCKSWARESGVVSIDSKRRLKTWVGLQYWGSNVTRHFAESWYQYKPFSVWLGGVTKYSIMVGKYRSIAYSHVNDCTNQSLGIFPSDELGLANRGYSSVSSSTYDAQRYSFHGANTFENAGEILRLGGIYHHPF